MEKDFKPTEEFFQELDKFLLEKIGSNFTIQRDVYGNYKLKTENHRIISFHRDNAEKKHVKKRH